MKVYAVILGAQIIGVFKGKRQEMKIDKIIAKWARSKHNFRISEIK